MVNFTFMKNFLLVFFSMFSLLLFSQNNINLNEKFKQFESVHIDTRSLYQDILDNRHGGHLTLKFNDKLSWDLSLENSNIVGKDYFLSEASDDGIKITHGTTAIPMKGHIVGQPNSSVSLTFNYGFIYGYIETDKDTYYIEPLRHYRMDAVEDSFIVYNIDDILTSREFKCGYEFYQLEMDKYRSDEHGHVESSNRAGQCLVIDIDLAADYSMVQKYGSVSGAENHNLGVLNNVQTNYDDEFPDELQFSLNEQWISSCNTCDPWSSSTDSGVLLNSFTSWAPGGFGTAHDVASLWSNRDFNGSTIGLAWVGTVCTAYRYNVLQDFSSDAQLKRCMQAHEIGHNFNADHSTTGIMAPSVSSANFWEAVSISQIMNFYNGLGCLSSCVPTNPVIANFTYQVIEPCVPPTVQFTNTSSNATTYSWSFPGGYPSTSTLQNPLVTYNDPGTYTVTLFASNGSSSDTKTMNVSISGIYSPIADFNYVVTDHDVNFYDIGSGATSYTWDFGDGSPLSYDHNPSHSYPLNGFYEVTMTVENQCGSSTISYFVEISVLAEVDFTSDITAGCDPITVIYLDKSTNGDSYYWMFPGGTPSLSTEVNPVVIYNDPGVYDVTLEVTNSAGVKTLTKTSYITVNTSPKAGFTYVLNNSQSTFTDTSHFATNYSWDFGDGGTSSQQNPVHNYLDNGTFTVTQTVTNGCTSKTKTETIVISQPPVPSFTSSYTSPICAGEFIEFTSTSTYSPTSYLWTFEGGTPTTSTLANPEIQYNTGGSFKVTLSVTNAFGNNELVLNNYVIVEAKPTVTFTFRADGLKLDFTQNISGSNDQDWDFGDGQTSKVSNPSHTYLNEGSYNVTLTAQNRCGVTEFSRNIEVLLFPTADFDAVSTTICPGGNVQFNNLSSESVTSWQWSFEGGTPATSGVENPIITYNNPGVYNVTLTVTNPSGQNTSTKQKFISVLPPVTATFTGLVTDNEIHLTNTGVGSSNSDWHIFNDGLSESLIGDNTIFVAPSNGVYNVVLTNTNLCGQAISDTAQYVISAYPVPSFSTNGGGILCADTIVNFVGIGGDNYIWVFDGGSPSTSKESNPSVQYVGPGSYSVTLIAFNTFGSDTLHTTVNVSTRPTAAFDFIVLGGTVQFTSNSSGQSGQLWEFGDKTTSSELNPYHTYSSNGDYQVTLFASNGCGIDTITRLVSITLVSVSDLQNEYGIKVYPNPASEFIQIQMTKNFASEYKLQLLNSTGIVVKEKQITATSDLTATLDVTDVKSGMYILNIKSDKLIIPYKISILK